MALKDWKKISDTNYVNKKRKGVLYIFDGNEVNISIDTTKISGIDFTKTMINEKFNTYPQALAYAKKYMRSH